MKKNILISTVLLLSAAAGYSDELTQIGDFSKMTGKTLPRQIYVMTGKMSLFTEQPSGNQCGKFEVVKISREQDKYDSVNETAFIGMSKKNIPGFTCKPDTVYEFSADIKGDAPWVEFKGAEWNTPTGVYGFHRLPGIKCKPAGEWQNVKLKFTTGAKAVRAAVWVQFWGNSKYTNPLPFKKGQYILIDNVSIKEIPQTETKGK